MSSTYLNHLSNSDDLVTTREETRAGFIALALEKNRRATPTVEQARALKYSASFAKTPMDLLKIDNIQAGLLTASGISDKAAKFMEPEDCSKAKQELIKNFLEPAGVDFIEELVFRFLITRGDALGGSMRNVGGVMAQQKLTLSILSALNIAGINYHWKNAGTNQWAKGNKNDIGIEQQLKGLGWKTVKGDRTLIFNINHDFRKIRLLIS